LVADGRQTRLVFLTWERGKRAREDTKVGGDDARRLDAVCAIDPSARPHANVAVTSPVRPPRAASLSWRCVGLPRGFPRWPVKVAREKPLRLLALAREGCP
jgi:hypothetical protein